MELNARVSGDGGRSQVRMEVREFAKKQCGEVLSCAVLK